MNAALKQWTVTVISPPEGPLEISRDGAALPTEIGPGLTTPVEVLLIAVGTCFALSCHAAFTLRGRERVRIEVAVTGRKAPQLPSRLADITLAARFDDSLPLEEAQAISVLAKQMCTVTNTVTADPPCAIRVDVVR